MDKILTYKWRILVFILTVGSILLMGYFLAQAYVIEINHENAISETSVISVVELERQNIPVEVLKPRISEPEAKEMPPTIPPELEKVFKCESGGKHLNPNGEVIRGVVNPKDVGIAQINLFYHGAEAEKMGLDLFKEEDNIKYAIHLYKTQGLQPWYLSKSCWGA